MKQLLQSKGIWKMLVEAQLVFTKENKRLSFQNKLDESMGLIGLHVLDSFLFHIFECTTPKSSWDKLDSLFSKVNKFRALKLEEELSSLVPNENASIEYWLSKFKLLVLQLKGFGKNKLDEECIFLILSKLKGPFQLFSSTFYSTMDALGSGLKFPPLRFFVNVLLENSLSLCN
jgi:hypothetical protein